MLAYKIDNLEISESNTVNADPIQEKRINFSKTFLEYSKIHH